MAIIFLISRAIYCVYCFRKYKECYLQYVWDKALIKKSSQFIGWNVLSSAQVAICDQGISILLNMFFGPIANAARGITSQVGGAVFKFVNSFLVAIQPQMVKSYAQNDIVYLKKLFYTTSRLSYIVLWLFACPIVIAAEDILNLWLVNVPMWTADMVRISMISSCVYVLSKPIWFIVIADGKLKKYTIITSVVSFMLFPLSYIVLQAGGNPLSVYFLNVALVIANIFFQLRIIEKMIHIEYSEYIKSVLIQIIGMSVISFFVGYYTYGMMKDCFNTSLLSIGSVSLITAILTFILGTTINEKKIVISKISTFLIKNKKR